MNIDKPPSGERMPSVFDQLDEVDDIVNETLRDIRQDNARRELVLRAFEGIKEAAEIKQKFDHAMKLLKDHAGDRSRAYYVSGRITSLREFLENVPDAGEVNDPYEDIDYIQNVERLLDDVIEELG